MLANELTIKQRQVAMSMLGACESARWFTCSLRSRWQSSSVVVAVVAGFYLSGQVLPSNLLEIRRQWLLAGAAVGANLCSLF